MEFVANETQKGEKLPIVNHMGSLTKNGVNRRNPARDTPDGFLLAEDGGTTRIAIKVDDAIGTIRITKPTREEETWVGPRE